MYFAWSILMRVMGISPFHDSSVAVVEDGKMVSFYKEERYTRKKRDNMPWKSIHRAMKKYSSFDYVVVCSPFEKDIWLPPTKLTLEKLIECPVVMYCDKHHLSHASTAFYNSGFDTSLVFVVDRNGSILGSMREAETVFQVSYPAEFKTLHKNYWVYNSGTEVDKYLIEDIKTIDHPYSANSLMSIVKVYESATTLIGEEQLENGKTMGLAGYGKDQQFQELFFEDGTPKDQLFIHSKYTSGEQSMTLYREFLGKETKNVSQENYQFYADYAYQVQKQTQNVLLNLIKQWVDKTGIKKVCLTGGYALNVVANGHLVKNLPDVEFYFEPLADDSGNSIGCAMHLYRTITLDTTINKLQHTFTHGDEINIGNIGESCTIEDISEYILDQKTVAVFNGLAESGPRALGNRSILFDARNVKAKELVNNVKKREWYRPFAAMVLKDKFNEFFETYGLSESKHMTISFQVKTKDIPGVMHADNSCRVQTVDSDVLHIHSLLKLLDQKTGIPVLLNTSFNLAGEPLVETLDDALRTFVQSDIDVLWFPESSSCLVKGSYDFS
jgi:carbamoyltransferase